MSDTKLRDLERRWKETGTEDDEAAYLLERLRVGDLTRERLELAVCLGYQPAIRALNVTPAHPLRVSRDAHWGHAFRDWPDAASRIGAALASAAAASVSALPPDTVAAVASVSIAIDEWVLAPTDDHARATRLRVSCPAPHEDEGELVWQQRHAAKAAANLTSLTSPKRRYQVLSNALELLVSAGVAQIRNVVAAEVVPWALGHEDPLRERVEARRREAAGG
jgi:hypothetical protein